MPTELEAALPRLRRYAWVLTGSLGEADELVVDTLEQAQRTERRHVPGESLRTQLFGLMHERYVVHRLRSSSGPEAVAAKPETDPATASEPSHVLEHFGDLPVEEREVLLLVAVEQMPYADIASVLGVSPATVIARLKRARERVRGAGSARAGEGSTL